MRKRNIVQVFANWVIFCFIEFRFYRFKVPICCKLIGNFQGKKLFNSYLATVEDVTDNFFSVWTNSFPTVELRFLSVPEMEDNRY